LKLLTVRPETALHPRGVLVIGDSGHRKAGRATAHVARQYLGSIGKIDNGIVVVSTLWADERVYYPLHAVPYTPARWFAGGKDDPDFATKPQRAADLVEQARWARVPFAAVVADSAYGPSDTTTLVAALHRAAGCPTCWHSNPTWESGRPTTSSTHRSRPRRRPAGRKPNIPGPGSR